MIPFVIPFVDRYPSTIDRCEDRRGYAKPSSSDAVGWAAVAARGGDRVAADGSRNVSHVGLRKDLSLSLSAEMPRRTDDFRRGGGKEGRTATLPTNSFRSSGE